MVNEILKIIPTLQAVNLIKRKRKKPVKSAIEDIIGISLIKEESDFIHGI